jgi:hypothetical protein
LSFFCIFAPISKAVGSGWFFLAYSCFARILLFRGLLRGFCLRGFLRGFFCSADFSVAGFSEDSFVRK